MDANRTIRLHRHTEVKVLREPSRTKYRTYKSSASEYVTENLQETAIQSGLERLKITYGLLHKRSSVWGPATHGTAGTTRSTSVSAA